MRIAYIILRLFLRDTQYARRMTKREVLDFDNSDN
jgi:hypothetical protein